MPLAGIFGGYNGVCVGSNGSYETSKEFWKKDGRSRVEKLLDDTITNTVGRFNVRASSTKGQQIGAILTMES